MNFQSVTVKEIAEALNVSMSTVSRALRDSHEIGAETKKKIIEYAKKVNYMPNPAALGLKNKKTKSIGIIVADITTSFFSQIIDGIESIALKEGYTVFFAQSKESMEREMQLINNFASKSVDGILVSLSAETNTYDHFTKLIDRGMPIVFLDRIVPELNTNTFSVDNFNGTYDATSYLINQGYKKIGILSANPHLSIYEKRIEGYKKALIDNKIIISPKMIQYCEHVGKNFKEVHNAINTLLDPLYKVDAIISLSDKITKESLKIFKEKKIAIPEKLGFIGFSNSTYMKIISPSVTTIVQPAFEMGKLATKKLLKIIESKRKDLPVEHVVLPVKFQKRDTVVNKKINIF